MTISMLSQGCLSVTVGTQKVDVYEQYPVYNVEQRPVLTNLTGEDMDAHKKVAELAYTVIKDGTVTPDEKAQFDKAMLDAEKTRLEALSKKVNNDRALIMWGKINQATVESYNEFARDKNERLKVIGK